MTGSATGTQVDTGSTVEQPVPAEITVGQMIGRYTIRKLLGTGGMGRVYLAYDDGLERDIALKIVATSVHNTQVLREARAIAALNHPNIVQVYERGVHDGMVYLALEYIEGASLRERLDRAPLSLDEALRCLRAIADALCHAHKSGVRHCDLKPANVMTGPHGEIKVVDFGIAQKRGVAGASGGTPGWMAPEQAGDGHLTDRVDSWALGLIAKQLLTTAHPDEPVSEPGSDRTPVPAGAPLPIANLIARSLEREPSLRPAAVDWREVLDEVIGGRTDAFVEDGPYPGLASFDERHARFFFGREREIDEFVERLRDSPHLPIVGPPGAGKSSFMHAGVIPRLRGRERWVVLGFRPGVDPVGALARKLLELEGADHEPMAGLHLKARVAELRHDLVVTPALLGARLAALATVRRARLLIAIDQLEEVFTLCESQRDAGGFVDMLLAAASDPLDPVRIVFTVRDDFIGRLPGLRSLFVLHELSAEALRTTITRPLARYSYEFDDESIVDDLLAEVANTRLADLPLLQFACRILWEGRDVDVRRLRRATYVEMGGLAGALGRHAEHALAKLTPDERRTARQLLLRLVAGTSRRSVPRDELVTARGSGVESVLRSLLSARLLVQRTDEDAVQVEIAHESLLQAWPQLARWIEDSAKERQLLEELENAASLWERRGRRVDETWASDGLAAARFRVAQLGITLPQRVETFLTVGEERHRRRRRRRRLIAVGVLAITVPLALTTAAAIANYLAREGEIERNAGTVDLVLRPYDWRDGVVPIAVTELDDLTWHLYKPAPGQRETPGESLPPNLVQVVSERVDGLALVTRVTAPGGTVFLRIDGRGRRGEACAPSWIRILAFPGFADTTEVPRYELPIPTCQASSADMQVVEAGDFIYGGPGEPQSPYYYADTDYRELETVVYLGTYSIDRTEVSNARLHPFAELEAITGYPAPTYTGDSDIVHATDDDPTSPVSEVDAFHAEAFCRYLGKRLPGDHEWVKAARGGIALPDGQNPYPRRLFPWGPLPEPQCRNVEGTTDGYRWIAPVDAYACGASPYGVLNLAGNVQEWIGRDGQLDHDQPLYVMRGGAADSPAGRHQASTIFRNHRDPHNFNFSIGFRCVLSP